MRKVASMRFSFFFGVVLSAFPSHESYHVQAWTPSKHPHHVSRPALYASTAAEVEVPPRAGRSLEDHENDNDDSNMVEFPPPLSRVGRLTRAATFWSKALPIVANYYGLIANIKLQETMGEALGSDEIEVSSFWSLDFGYESRKIREKKIAADSPVSTIFRNKRKCGRRNIKTAPRSFTILLWN
jgi:hypothetical protein